MPDLNAMDVYKEWAISKSDVICRLINNCNCPGDSNGADPERAICWRVEALIDRLTQEYSEQQK